MDVWWAGLRAPISLEKGRACPALQVCPDSGVSQDLELSVLNLDSPRQTQVEKHL